MRKTTSELTKFAGSWCGTDNIAHSLWGASNSAFVRIENRLELSGRFMVQEYIQECNGLIRYQWHSVIGWNQHANFYIMYLFDSAGFFAAEPFQGKRIGKRLSFSQKGQNGNTRMVHEVLRNGKYKLSIEVSPDNKMWFRSMQSIYDRDGNDR